MRTIFTTKDVHPRDRFEYWHSVACKEIVEHDSFPTSRVRFEAEIEVGSVGTLDLVAFENTPLRVEHTHAHISRRSSDQLFFCREASGSVSMEQDGRQITLHPGDMTLLDPALPYSATFSGGSRTLVLKLPRRELQARLGNPRSMLTRRIQLDATDDALTSSFSTALPGLAGLVRPVCGQLAANFMLDLVALSLAKAAESTTLRVSSTKAMAILEIRATIKSRLADPELDAQSVADAVGLSVRYINKILASQDTSIARLILRERLERCRQALEDPVQPYRSLSEVAFGWGFSDLTHFGRCFKKAYGISPSEYQLSHRKT
ncbi:AraC family transcriptional activator of tynA and feaB [Bradyrhizobium huanghuaihaiense]|uniref:AraC-like DNA-binding protein n=1 Tax=Bradyrhizobium huanghuaihaiense TaxID=990078 RepID=A0A562RMV5_9BRAD|nr:helix-turn-helix domain-containing protein [Bradyrhizobium huanghuaihaiense]TWI70391.1 AraC-like DNA-binding protein [Bradyrhizobium huanghuaihaiense]